MNFKFLLLVFLGITSFNLNAQVFVNSAATGANNGSSWANAYTSLSNAIANAPANAQLWIAAGTYKPGTTRNDYFDIQQGLELYGGFAGNETALSQRDFNSNLTILSGDIAGNDIAGDFTNNKTDNTRHIIFVPNILTDLITIDGFVFEGGHTDPSTGGGDDRRGSSILSYSKVKVANSTFRQNWSYFGAVYARQAGANDSEIINCTFEDNAGYLGAGVFLASTIISVDNSTFKNNYTDLSGGGTLHGGSSLYATNSTFAIDNSTFDNNTSRAGAGVYITAQAGGTHICTIKNSDFSNNSCDFGGAVQSFSAGVDLSIENTTFTNNSVTGRGGAVGGDTQSSFSLKGCTFTGNTAALGGALGVFDVGPIKVEDCTFINNVATAGLDLGGAILYAGSPSLTVIGSTFDGNTAGNGGAIHSENSAGGTIISISKTIFENNTATNLGGGINISNADLEIDDCLFADNTAAATGGGATLSTSVTGGTTTISNSTFANNAAPGAGGIAQVINNSGALDLVLKNTILDNTTANYQNNSPGGLTPTVNSAGGNLSSDATLTADLTATNDLNNTPAGFVSAVDYHLAAGSLAINNGVGSVSSTDLDGNQRVGAPDSGAYEYQGTSNNDQVILDASTISVFPNPVSEVLNFELNNDWTGMVQLDIVDAKGAVVFQTTSEKNQTAFNKSIPVSNLVSGTYHLTVRRGSLIELKTFIVNN